MKETFKNIFKPARGWATSRFIKSTGVLYLGDGLKKLLLLSGSVLLARKLGSELYGAYALVLSLGAALPFFLDLGIKKTILSKLPEHFHSRDRVGTVEILAYAMKASLMSTCAIIILGLPFLPWIAAKMYGDISLGYFAWLLCFTNLLNIPFLLTAAVLESSRQMSRVVVFELISEIIRVGLLALALFMNLGLRGVIASLVVSAALLGVLSIVVYKRIASDPAFSLPSIREITQGLGKAPLSRYFRFSVSVGIGKKIQQGTRMLLVLILGYYAAKSEVGQFRVAMSLMAVPLGFLTPISRNLFPKLAELRAKADWENYKLSHRAISLAAGFGSAFVTIFFTLVLPSFVNLVYGREYMPAVTITYIFLALFIINGFYIGVEAFCILNGRIAYLNQRFVFGFVLTLCLAFILVPNHGPIGAAIAAVAGGAAVHVMDQFYIVNKIPRLGADGKRR